MTTLHPLMRSVTAALLAVLFAFEATFIHAAEASLWTERRRAMGSTRPAAPAASDQSSDDKNKKPSDGETLLAALPAVRGGLATLPQTAAVDLSFAGIQAKDGAPAWVQTAVTKFATINSARLTGNAASPTVFLMQDAHLHVEAQRNIQGAAEALAAEVAARGQRLLVALEGAPVGDVDFSDYAKDPAPIRRAVVDAFVKTKILSGAEGAAVATAGSRDGKDLVDVAGLEEFGLFKENVEALRATSADRKNAAAALADLRRELTDLKKKHFDADLIKFDGRKDAYEAGKLGLPTFALYLDSVVPAAGPNLRELIEAALLEGALKFDRVESERRRLLAKLVEKMTEAEVKGLLQASLMFRAGQVSYASYYEIIKALAARRGVPLSDFPEMNVYIQYVLKSEGIDHRALFSELAAQEELVQKRLAKTPEQKEILSLVSDLHLMTKLVNRELIESEWHQLEGRRPEIARLLERLTALGGRAPETAQRMAPRWPAFENFYVAALKRNDAMIDNLRAAIERKGAKHALMVAGGFHTDGLAVLLRKNGMNAVVLSPRITKIGEGPTSLDFLAAGRLPLNRIFVGEKLFLPTPMVTTMPGVQERVRDAIGGFVAAVGTALANNLPAAVSERGGKVYAAESTTAGDGLVASVEGRSFQLTAQSAGTAYVGWARAVFILATVTAAVLFVGVDMRLMTNFTTGAWVLVIAPLITAALIFAEEQGHLVMARRQGRTDAKFSWRELGVVNAGDAWTMQAVGQIAFFSLGLGFIGLSALVLGSPLAFLVLPLAVISFVNPEGRQWMTNALAGRRLLPALPARVTGFAIAAGAALLMVLGGAGGVVGVSAMVAMIGVAEVGRYPGIGVPALVLPGGGTVTAATGPSSQDLIDQFQSLVRMEGDVSRPAFVGLISLMAGTVLGLGLLFTVGPAAGVAAAGFTVVAGSGLFVLTRLEDRTRAAAAARRAAVVTPIVATPDAPTVVRPAPAPAGARSRPVAPAPPPAPAPVRRPATPARETATASARSTAVDGPVRVANVIPGESRTVSRNVGRFFAAINANRDRFRAGQPEEPIQIAGARELIAFYMALAAYSDGSKGYFRRAEEQLRISDSMDLGVRQMIQNEMRDVIFRPKDIDQIFDKFDRQIANNAEGRPNAAVRGYILTAYLLSNRTFGDFNSVATSRAPDLAKRNARNKMLEGLRAAEYSFSDDNSGLQQLNVNQIAFVSGRILALSRLIDNDVRQALNRNLREMNARPAADAVDDRFIEEVGAEVSKILHNNFPALELGGSIAGFDKELGDLLRYLTIYSRRAAERAGQPERANEILGRILNVASIQRVTRASGEVEEEVPTIWQFGTNNVQGRKKLDAIMSEVSAAIEIEEARGTVAAEANARLKELAEANPESDEPASQVANPAAEEPANPADAPVPTLAELARDLRDRPLIQQIKLTPFSFVGSVLFVLDNGRTKEQTLALLITRLETLRAAIRSGEVRGTDALATQLGTVVRNLRQIYRAGGDIDPAAVRATLGATVNEPVVSAVVSPMLKFPAAILDAALAGPAATVGAFYNNDMAEKLAEAIVKRTNDPSSIIGTMVGEFYAQLAPTDLGKILNSLTLFNVLGSRALQPGDQARLANALKPLFGPQMPLAMAEIVLRAAAYTVDKVSAEADRLDSEFRNMSTFFSTNGQEIEVQLLNDQGAVWNQQSAFFQQVDGKLIVRITRTTLRSIVGKTEAGKLDITGTLAELQQKRLLELGVRVTDQQASDLALRIFITHELGEGGLLIEDSALTARRLADTQRTADLDKAEGVRPEGAYVSKEGLIGELAGLGGKIGAPLSLKPGLTAAERRQLELAALTILSEARPILSQLFPNRRVLNYSLGASEDGKEVVFDADGRLDTENLNVLQDSPLALSRMAAMGKTKEPFKDMETEEVVQKYDLRNPRSFAIYDLRGGLKLLADQLAAIMSDPARAGERLEIGSLRKSEEMLADAKAYVELLRRKAAAAPELAEELRRAEQLQAQLELSFQQAPQEAAGQQVDAAVAARIAVVALETPEVITFDEKTGAYDVTGAVQVLQALASARFKRPFANIVLVSDWRTLVAEGINNAISVMAMNSFLTLEEGIKATNLVATQA